MSVRLNCEIPEDCRSNSIAWLEIEEADGGFSLFQYEDIREPCRWDSFYHELEDVFEDCLEGWGIQRGDWKEGTKRFAKKVE